MTAHRLSHANEFKNNPGGSPPKWDALRPRQSDKGQLPRGDGALNIVKSCKGSDREKIFDFQKKRKKLDREKKPAVGVEGSKRAQGCAMFLAEYMEPQSSSMPASIPFATVSTAFVVNLCRRKAYIMPSEAGPRRPQKRKVRTLDQR